MHRPVSCLLFLALTMGTLGIPLSQFYLFGASQGDTYLQKNDDGSSPEIHISTTFPYFHNNHSSLFVNTNGDITFITSLSTFTPAPFPYNQNSQIIGVYWGDVDTREGGDVLYRESTNSVLLQRASREVQAVFPEQIRFHATWMFIATWKDVAFYGANSAGKRKRCTFQCVMVTDGRFSFAMYNYNKLQWTTGTASNGSESTGLGGTPAQIGFDAGDGTHFYVLPGSRTPSVTQVTHTSNINVPGKYMFRLDLATIERATTIDECENVVCQNYGTCVDLDGLSRWHCNCIPGYTGRYCETDINECASSPCLHGGYCADMINAFKCHCKPGYSGSSCEIDINECESSPCLHGSMCNDLENHYSCNCLPGNVGVNCQIDIDECASSPCYNNATCVDRTPGWTCECLPGYTGVNCQTDINECQSYPCQHNSTCVDLIDDYKCICTNESTGEHCETWMDHCSSLPCLHGGTCANQYGGFTCECPEAWHGYICEYEEINRTEICTDLQYTECSCFIHQLKPNPKNNKVVIGTVGFLIGLLSTFVVYGLAICFNILNCKTSQINPANVSDNEMAETKIESSTDPPPKTTPPASNRLNRLSDNTPRHNCYVDHTGFDFMKLRTDKDGNCNVRKCRHYK